tara:strand:+ start:1125 stop:1496 length:372 start_codon:yes stop_codon:yes gene_type:complete
MHQNSQLAELLAPHQKHSNSTGIARKYGYSTAPEELTRGIAATIRVQLTPHGKITSYPTPTSTELEDNKCLKQRLNRKQYTQNSYEVTLAVKSDIPEEIMGRRKRTCIEVQDTISHTKVCYII